jgi:outer membrane protein assembly factor BamE (lipoprotein component of BamABCDE complex)
MRLACLLLIQALCLSACEKNIINRGYIVSMADFRGIAVGKDTNSDVMSKVGSPTMRSSIRSENGDYSWYYVYKKSEKNGFLDPKIIEQKIIAVTFSANGIVRSVKECAGGADVKAVSEKTKTSGKTKGVLGETFGGLGKYMKRYTKEK